MLVLGIPCKQLEHRVYLAMTEDAICTLCHLYFICMNCSSTYAQIYLEHRFHFQLNLRSVCCIVSTRLHYSLFLSLSVVVIVIIVALSCLWLHFACHALVASQPVWQTFTPQTQQHNLYTSLSLSFSLFVAFSLSHTHILLPFQCVSVSPSCRAFFCLLPASRCGCSAVSIVLIGSAIVF